MRPATLLEETAHRPYPLPQGPWIMAQRWHDLLFAHWRLPPDVLRQAVPAPLELDLHGGAAWIGIVPFTMSGVRLRGTPGVPWISSFPELNVRTYVRYGDRAGVYFFSLDAGSRLAVASARRWYRLPYYRARMAVHRRDGEIDYVSRRAHRGAPPAELHVQYRACGEGSVPAHGSLDRWLVERYRLLNVSKNRVLAAEIHHPAWRLRPATAKFHVNTMTKGLGVELPDAGPRLAFAERQDVTIWSPTYLEG